MSKSSKPERTVYADGREVLTGQAWKNRKLEVYLLDERRCRQCGKLLYPSGSDMTPEAECHHRYGRGMSGSKRDDRIFLPDGTRNLETLCRKCHAQTKIKSLRKSKIVLDIF
jgi:5-methylcytosine-specific restriction endonuclease McrA